MPLVAPSSLAESRAPAVTPSAPPRPALSAPELRAHAFTYRLRGWLVLTAALSNYALALTGFTAPWLPWLVLMPLLAVGQAIHARRQAPAASKVARQLRWLQQSFLLALLLALVGASRLGWEAIHPPLLVSYGLATWAAGHLLAFRPLRWGGLLGVGLGVAAGWVPASIQLLLIAGVMLGSYLLPGYALARHSRRAEA